MKTRYLTHSILALALSAGLTGFSTAANADGQRGDRNHRNRPQQGHHRDDRWGHQGRGEHDRGQWRQHGASPQQWQGDRRHRNQSRIIYSRPSYRYHYHGRYRDTNEDGARLLRNALNYGYQQGLRSAQSDRWDNSRYDYRNCDAYRDGSYGYQGLYLEQSQYAYYFRQGFQRGYDDGYYSRARYGAYQHGRLELMVSLFDDILDLRLLR